ncbi:hypothetical protein Vadar_016289 [Vaccinium darrowii]|uniref:Uncharacterized protein n=1 Tax=Vaccinium darrowii TaxID=229202 RepID=A0ACB7Y141_9ERIC|nr:hypothetical protein Vadar_016289 [Vaccinium darrowii]
MEKLIKPYDREYMKMAMLKHEETFKLQVYELHRLYRIQKTLMQNIDNKRPSGSKSHELRYWDSSHHTTHQNHQQGIDLGQPAHEEYTAEFDGDGELEIEDESEIELTLGPSSYIRRKKAETPRSSVFGPSFSSSCSTGEELRGHNKWTGNNSFGVEEELRIGRLNQHPWLFQAFSLNMT